MKWGQKTKAENKKKNCKFLTSMATNRQKRKYELKILKKCYKSNEEKNKKKKKMRNWKSK